MSFLCKQFVALRARPSEHTNCVTPRQRDVLTFEYFAFWDGLAFRNKRSYENWHT